jgi:hypothetical protein
MTIFDELEDVGEDVVGTVTGVVEGLVNAGASLFDGPGGLVGVLVSAGQLYVQGPGALIPALAVGAGVSAGVNALIKQRPLSFEESVFAQRVFADTLPARERIILTNLADLGGRYFTWPNVAGQFLVNIGDAFDNPMAFTNGHYVAPGQVLIHELTHAWQIHHSSFVAGLICESIADKARDQLGENVYDYEDGGKQWSEYNLEQQAAIVDHWYQEGLSDVHPFYRYIQGNIRGRSPSALTFPMTSKGPAESAVARTPNRLDVYWIGPDGGVGSTAWEGGVNGGAWARHFPVAPPGVARLDSPVVAVARTPNRLDVFWVGRDGGIGSTAWEGGVNGGAWARHFPVAPPGAARPNSPVVAVARTPNRLDVYWIGPNDGIWSTAWEGGVNNNGWAPVFPVTRPDVTRDDSSLAVIARTPNRLDVFWVGRDGGIGSTAWEGGVNGGAWAVDFPVARPGVTRAGAALAAIARTPNRLDVFWIGSDGGIGSTAWEGGVNGGAWAPDFPVARPGVTHAGAALAAIARTPNRLDVFWIGSDGGLGSTAWEGGVNGGAWAPDFPVAAPGAARTTAG